MPSNYQAIIENGKAKRLDTPPSKATTKPSSKKRQLGFMQGEMTLPDEINWGDKQIQGLFAQN